MRFPHNLRESFDKMALEHGFEVDVVPFDRFIEFVEQWRCLLCSRFGRLLLPPRGKSTPPTKFGQKTRANLIHSNNGRDTPQVNVKSVPKRNEPAACRCCDAGVHLIFRCEVFSQKPTAEQLQLVRQKRPCFNCLKSSHVVKDCPSKARCRECAGKHHLLSHLPASNTKRGAGKGRLNNNHIYFSGYKCICKKWNCRNSPSGNTCMCHVTGVCKETFCLLDSGADCHLIDGGLYSDLDLSGRPMWSELHMANGELEKLDTFSLEFGIRGLNEREVFTLENM